MLQHGQSEKSRTGDDTGASRRPAASTRSGHTRLRWLAVFFGLLATLLSLSVPFLPVTYGVTTLKWPTAEGTKPVSAPLVSFSPIWLKADIPCATARTLDDRTNGPANLITTNPPNSPYSRLTGLVLQVNEGQVNLLVKGRQLGSAPLPPGDCAIAVRSDGARTSASVGSQTLASVGGDQRPQLTGIYSDINSKIDDVRGLSFQARVDDRFQSSPTVLKLTVMGLAVLAFIASVVCLRRMDVRHGRRPPRLAPSGWWKPTLRDVAVVGALIIWWLIGAMTADDGYFLTMARIRQDVGYISSYYRWFAVPETPVDWFVDLYSWWVQISTATPWVRLPSLLMAILSWFLISREVLPRLGQQVRRSGAAGWAAAAVFLAFWMPYNNGLRPEPVVVLFSLFALCAVERTIATGRLLPAAIGLVGAAFAVGANPHGMVAVLPYLAGLKPLLKLLRKRAQEFGWLPLISTLSACGFVILSVVFADQTWQAIMDGTELRTQLGPNMKWYQELHRYNLLFSPIPDGSLTRRFPVLLVMLCLVTCVVVLLRRGQIRGAALGPSRRLLAVTALTFVALALTPTKHTHHFGIFAAVGGALAALTALATSSTVLRSRRNRAGFFAGLMVISAFSATGTNAWWYVSGWGVPWTDRPPSYDGHYLSTLLLVIAGIAGVVALVEHLRLDEDRPKVVPTSLEKRSRALRLGTAPLSIICAVLMVSELATFGKVIDKQWGSYSMGWDNIKQLTGSSCGMSDYVYVETNPLAGMLRVSSDQPHTAAAPTDPTIPVPPTRLEGKEEPNQYLRAKMEGFRRPGLPPSDPMIGGSPSWKPPNRFGGDNAPVWGSYEYTGTGVGELRTQWYDLPERAAKREVPVVVSAAGSAAGANALAIEFGKDTDKGFQILDRRFVGTGPPMWQDHRLMADGKAEGATKLRISALDRELGPNGWLAVSAPRAPQLTNMTDFVRDAPTFIEWTAALVHPCLQPSSLHHGIAEMPKFRVAGGGDVRAIGQGWSSPEAGGPFGWMNVTTSMRELPTYLRNNMQRDWGSLYAVDPYEPDALPAQSAMDIHQETHWGTWAPGPLSKTVSFPGDVPSSNDRSDIGEITDEHK